jgi:DNA-binding MarR family transcriptional regulator
MSQRRKGPATMPDSFALGTFLPYRLAVLAGQISREYSRIYQEKYGLSRAEWRVMAHLSQEDAVSVREIHARVDMDKSKVSRAAARLEETGVITKSVSAEDRRLVVLALTDKGRAMMEDLAPIAAAFHADLVARLGPDAAPFLRGLDALTIATDTCADLEERRA